MMQQSALLPLAIMLISCGVAFACHGKLIGKYPEANSDTRLTNPNLSSFQSRSSICMPKSRFRALKSTDKTDIAYMACINRLRPIKVFYLVDWLLFVFS